MLRPLTAVVAGALALTACSGGASEPEAADPSPTVVEDDTVDDDTVDDEAAASSDAALAASDEATSGSDVVEQWSVTIDVVAEGFAGPAIDTSVGWTGDPNDVVADGPFGEFASCSGLRDDVAAYSVFVSGDGELEAVEVWTAARVTGAGIYDAEVRIERLDGESIDASGTMTILEGFQEGEFLALGPDGGRVEGTFSCSGTEPGAPLRAGAAGVELFAVIRDGDAERIVDLATDDSDAVTCAAAADPILSVDGDAATGSITAVSLGGGPDGAARLRIAGTDYEFADLDVQLAEGAATSGVFSASSADGVSVDGAFRCD